MSDFSVNLDEALKNKGWKQNEAAEHFGVSQANISRWLKDEHRPSVEQIMKVARALGVSIDSLLQAPGKLRESGRPYDIDPNFARWFRQARAAWNHHPEDRHRIKTGIELAWPNQAEEILKWLETSKP